MRQENGSLNTQPALARAARSLATVLLGFSLTACHADSLSLSEAAQAENQAKRIAPGVTLLESLPHPNKAFTQGLEFHAGLLYESSGLYGRSYIAKDSLGSEPVYRKLPDQFFAEGLSLHEGKLYLLTWKAGTGLVLNAEDLSPIKSFRYTGEGWGLCHDGERLIMSDGSDTLRFLDPEHLQQQGQLAVHYRGAPLDKLNELECHRGKVLANRWYDNHIYVIDPKNGAVSQRFDLSVLRQQVDNDHAVLNGIAYDPEQNNWLVTGKLWPQMHRLELDIQ